MRKIEWNFQIKAARSPSKTVMQTMRGLDVFELVVHMIPRRLCATYRYKKLSQEPRRTFTSSGIFDVVLYINKYIRRPRKHTRVRGSKDKPNAFQIRCLEPHG